MRRFNTLIGIFALLLSSNAFLKSQSSCGQGGLPNSCPIIEQPIFSNVDGNCTITFLWNKCSSSNNCLQWDFDQDGDFTIESVFFSEGACTIITNGDVSGTIKRKSSNADPNDCETDGTTHEVLVVTYSGPCAPVPNFIFTWTTWNSGNCNGGNCNPAGGQWIYEDEDIFNTPTPVKFGVIESRLKGSDVMLEWTTLSEINNEGFEVQRSTAGNKFETLDFVTGQGNSSRLQAYHYIDYSPENGTNIYRLKQIDLDGRVEYSPMTSVKIDHLQSMTVVPNPFQKSFGRLHIFSKTKEISQFDIFSLNGKHSQTHQIEVELGETGINLSDYDLLPGIYFARLVLGGEVLQTKFAVL